MAEGEKTEGIVVLCNVSCLPTSEWLIEKGRGRGRKISGKNDSNPSGGSKWLSLSVFLGVAGVTACNITGMKKGSTGARWIGVTAVAGLMRESTVFLGQIRKKRALSGLPQQVYVCPYSFSLFFSLSSSLCYLLHLFLSRDFSDTQNCNGFVASGDGFLGDT